MKRTALLALTLALLFGCKSKPLTTQPATTQATTEPTTKPLVYNLYHRLGGEPAIRAIVDEAVARVAADPRIDLTRKGTAREHQPTDAEFAQLKRRLVQFFASIAGGPIVYEGKPMNEAHRGMKITNAEFDALAADIKAAMDHLNVYPADRDELMTLIAATRSAIVE